MLLNDAKWFYFLFWYIYAQRIIFSFSFPFGWLPNSVYNKNLKCKMFICIVADIFKQKRKESLIVAHTKFIALI